MKQFFVATFTVLLLGTITLTEGSSEDHLTDTFNICGKRKPNGIGYQELEAAPEESEYGEFPWAMAILKRDPASGEQHHCGGSLIHPSVVLTAAHCVDEYQPNQLFIRGGEWDTSNNNEPIDTQNRSVIEIETHPEYFKDEFQNDVALLFMNEPMNLNKAIQTVCLPPAGATFDDQNCLGTGWGKRSFNDTEDYQGKLKKLELPIVPSAECEEILSTINPQFTFELHEGCLCGGGKGGSNLCTGDGGSALVCAINGSEYYHQIGIALWGFECSKVMPGVYAGVSHYREWIDQEMQERQLEISSYVPTI